VTGHGDTGASWSARRWTQLRPVLLPLLKRGLALWAVFEAAAVTILELTWLARRQRYRHQYIGHPDFTSVTVGQNRLLLYADGEDLFPDMLAAIRTAREAVYLESFIFRDDAIGRAFKAELSARADAGVDVYVLVDGFATLLEPARFKRFPKNVHTLAYTPFRQPWDVIDLRHYAFEHRKLLVADGRVGFIGGFNIADANSVSWRDTQLRIEGPAAAELAGEFEHFWSWLAPKQRIERRYRRTLDPLIRVLGTDAHRMTFPIRNMYMEAVERAERRIWLTNPYFVPDPALLDELKAAGRRGVDVRVLLPWQSNHGAIDWLSRGNFSACLAAGIRIFGYDGMIHAKTCTVDGVWSTIGTANLDRLSSAGNYEINVEVYSEALASQMEALFESDARKATEITAEAWARRPATLRLGETLIAPLRVLA